MSELAKRIIVAAIGIPLAVYVFYIGGEFLAGVLIIISAMALHEYYTIAERNQIFSAKILGILSGIILQALIYYYYRKSDLETGMILSALLFLILVPLVFGTRLWKHHKNNYSGIASTFTGILYVPMMLTSLIILRDINLILSYDIFSSYSLLGIKIKQLQALDPNWGAWFLLSIFVTIWICDSAAFFVGKAIGKNKLFPRHSPKKTWEGAIGGFVLSIFSMIGATQILIPEFPIVHAVAIGVIIGIFGQIGDLAESQLKRDVGIKDSSSILPGHGGILDRFDSIIFVSPIILAYMILNLIKL